MLCAPFRPFARVFLTLCSVAAPIASAQVGVGVEGTVSDTSGAVIVGARVAAIVAGRAVASTTSGGDGAYRIDVPPGVPVELLVHADGFADQAISLQGAVVVTRHDVTLRVGGVSDTLVVTASRGVESRATVTESVTLLTRADIEALGSASLADVMQYVPGVHVTSAGREGAVASMFSRGGESDYNLVLIDGVRVNQSGGIFDFSRISAADIDRLEVVRGAQSSLWGSDAMGAVVHIFTRRAGATDAAQVSGSAEGGSLGTFRGHARVNGGAGRRVEYAAGVSRRRSEGAFSSLLAEPDRFEETAVDATAGGTIGARLSVRGGVRYAAGSGRSVGQITYGSRDTGGVYDTHDLSGHVDLFHSLGSRFSGTASVNYFRYKSVSGDTVADPAVLTYVVLSGTPNALFPHGTRLVRVIDAAEFDALAAAGAAPAPGQFLAARESFDFPFTSATAFRRPAFRYQGDYAWGGQRLSVGYDWEQESNPSVPESALGNHAVFVQQELTLRNRWFATVGARVDRKDTYDTFVSPKISVGGYLLPLRSGAFSSLKVFGNVGAGIKSPTYDERFGGAFTDPSPGLQVEHARTGDTGVEATFADQRFRVLGTYFDNDFRDQVAYAGGTGGDGIPDYVNVDGSTAHGWEVEWALQRPVAGVTASATYAYVDHRVVTNLSTSQQFQPGQPLLRRPRHAGSARIGYLWRRAVVSFDARMVGDRHDHSFLFLRTVPNATMPSAVTTDITVNPGHTVMGASLDLRAHDAVTFFLRVDNIRDAAYENVLGYPGAPRTLVAGARFNVTMR
jgi:outer membrane cobalamin receptor